MADSTPTISPSPAIPPLTPPVAPHAADGKGTDKQSIRIYQHSPFFYYWPIWVMGYLIALLTIVDGHYLAVVPKDTKVTKLEKGYRLETTGSSSTLEKADAEQKMSIHMANGHGYGAIFITTLLLVIAITNVQLRGLWSVVIIVTVVLLGVIFFLANWWDDILNSLLQLRVYINLAGYLYLSTGLFMLWAISVLFFDRQTYMIFTPGQLKVCLEIGGGETAYDTMGMTIQKQQDDMFRHLLLGFGSGDLIVRTSGANSHEFHMINVLQVGKKLQMIEEMQRERPTVQG